MARIVLLTNELTTAGTYPFGPLALPSAITYATMDFDVTEARAGDDVSYATELSIDGGVNWTPGPVGRFNGGIPHRLDGLPILPSLVSRDTWQVPFPGVARQIRGVVTVTGATRRLQIGVEAT